MRYFLVGYAADSSIGNLWFKSYDFPSNSWMKKVIKEKYPEMKSIAIFSIQELSENDYNDFIK